MNGFTDNKVHDYEIRHRALARRAAAEGMVLLKNKGNILPLAKNSAVALFGMGAVKTVKGGTGSGDVNERYAVSVWQGLKNAGFRITTEEWLSACERKFDQARIKWRDCIMEKMRASGDMNFFAAYSTVPFVYPAGNPVTETDADAAVYVISRIAGEGSDRRVCEGDYLLTEEEKRGLKDLCRMYRKVIVAVNAGGEIDLSFLDEFPGIGALLSISQPGMEGGNAFADIVAGEVTPSGKLTDSWPDRYEKYPNAKTFSFNSGSVWKEEYCEGLYVGYRYFDSFDIPVKFGFGFGLSYTEFEEKVTETGIIYSDCRETAVHYGSGDAEKEPMVMVKVRVTNTGKKYSGKEVAEIYASLPDGRLEKEYRRLVGFAKTGELKPGESEELKIFFPLYRLSSYDETVPGYLLEEGMYGIWAGNSLETAKLSALFRNKTDLMLVTTGHVCAPEKAPEELSLPKEKREIRYASWKDCSVRTKDLCPERIPSEKIFYDADPVPVSEEARKAASLLSEEQLLRIVIGDYERGQSDAAGSSGAIVPGAAGVTGSVSAEELKKSAGINESGEKRDIPAMVLADGPAGLRLDSEFYVSDGTIRKQCMAASLEHGFFVDAFMKMSGQKQDVTGEKRYQYCSAFPVGSLLSQSWNTGLLEEIGEAVSEEMEIFQVKLWLAPGMNIHRNPLCGRNFEYYSEDPVLSGCMAASIAKGVQKGHATGVTLKHFCANNQEDNRMGSNDVISERTLREIYMKGFEIAVKMSQPYAIMTSYNLINGVHTANSRDLCVKAARNEWGMKGLIMTDWMTTTDSTDQTGCTAAGCMKAGNDLIMPGAQKDFENIREALKSGELPRADVEKCAARVIDAVWREA